MPVILPSVYGLTLPQGVSNTTHLRIVSRGYPKRKKITCSYSDHKSEGSGQESPPSTSERGQKAPGGFEISKVILNVSKNKLFELRDAPNLAEKNAGQEKVKFVKQNGGGVNPRGFRGDRKLVRREFPSRGESEQTAEESSSPEDISSFGWQRKKPSNIKRFINAEDAKTGSQVLRATIGYSLLMDMPIRIHGIRKGKLSAGLQAKHLALIDILKEVCSAEAVGDSLGSENLTLWRSGPRKALSRFILSRTNPGGSSPVLAFDCLPALLMIPLKSLDDEVCLSLEGVTHKERSMSPEYLEAVFALLKKHLDLNFSVNVIHKGYFSHQPGEMEVRLAGQEWRREFLPPFQIVNRGEMYLIMGKVVAAELTDYDAAWVLLVETEYLIREHYRQLGKIPVLNFYVSKDYIDVENVRTNKSCCITLTAITSTGCVFCISDVLGRHSPISTVAERVAGNLIEAIGSGACVDKHMQDKIAFFMALSKGVSKIWIGQPEPRLLDTIFVAQKLTRAKFNLSRVSEREFKKAQIRCVDQLKKRAAKKTKARRNQRETTFVERWENDTKQSEMKEVVHLLETDPNVFYDVDQMPWLLTCSSPGVYFPYGV